MKAIVSGLQQVLLLLIFAYAVVVQAGPNNAYGVLQALVQKLDRGVEEVQALNGQILFWLIYQHESKKSWLKMVAYPALILTSLIFLIAHRQQ